MILLASSDVKHPVFSLSRLDRKFDPRPMNNRTFRTLSADSFLNVKISTIDSLLNFVELLTNYATLIIVANTL